MYTQSLLKTVNDALVIETNNQGIKLDCINFEGI